MFLQTYLVNTDMFLYWCPVWPPLCLEDVYLFNPYVPIITVLEQSEQWRSWSDTTERGIWSRPTLFAYMNFYLK